MKSYIISSDSLQRKTMVKYLPGFLMFFLLVTSSNWIDVYATSAMDRALKQSFELVLYNDSVYEEVQQLPYLKGHKKQTAKQLRKDIEYPSVLKLKGVESKVVVSFVVNTYGRVTSATIEEGDVAELNEETLKTVLNSGPWEPAKINGQYVACRMKVVIPFELTSEERKYAAILKPIDFDNKPPLFVLDGKIVTDLMMLEDYNVRSIRVLKGEKAVALYGSRGANGVVEFTSKNGTAPVR